jgi:hypothetical protein
VFDVDIYLNYLEVLVVLAVTLIIFFIPFIVLTYYGIVGGRWLWKSLASSNIFQSKMSIITKLVGIISLGIFFVFIVVGIQIFIISDTASINFIVDNGTKMMFFATFYNIGYLISIRKPTKSITPDKPQENVSSNGNNRFKFKTKSIKKGLLLLGISIGLFGLVDLGLNILFLDNVILQESFNTIKIYFLLGSISIFLGWIFWEHLKESNMLVGAFYKMLWKLSIIFEIPVAALTFIGILMSTLQILTMNPYILLGYLLLFQLMWAYFLGLMIETIKKKTETNNRIK